VPKNETRQFAVSLADFLRAAFFVFKAGIEFCRQKTEEFFADLPINKYDSVKLCILKTLYCFKLDPACGKTGNDGGKI